MTDEEVERLKLAVRYNTGDTHVHWIDGDDVPRRVDYIGTHEDESGPIANIVDRGYVALDNCELRSFAFLTPLS